MGDSAGGNMAVVLTMMAAEDALPSPSRHVLISPGLDVSLTNPEVLEAERYDPWLGIPGGLEAVRLYSAGFDRSDWHISPLYGDLSVLPKTLLLTGSRDMLTPDNLIFAQKARAAGVEVEVVYEEGMFHVWPLIDMPEARRARDSIVAFLTGETETTRSKPANWALQSAGPRSRQSRPGFADEVVAREGSKSELPGFAEHLEGRADMVGDRLDRRRASAVTSIARL